MKNQVPDIYVVFEENIPEEFIGYCISDFYREDLNLQLQKREKEVYASSEWIIPTAIIAYVLKPYFDGFLKELAKDHYLLVKEGLKKMASSGKLIDSKLITAANSTNKLSLNYNQSLVFSLIIETKNDKQIKLLFDNSLDKTDWDEAINKILDFAIEHYEKESGDILSKLIEPANPRNKRMIYARINLETKEIEFCDDNKLAEYYKT